MTKKGPITEAEKFYILHHLDLHPRAVGKKLGRSFEFVSEYISTLSDKTISKHKKLKRDAAKKESEKNNSKVETKSKETLLSQQFARNNNGSTIMTPNASIMADGRRGQFKGSPSRPDCTTSIREDVDG